MCTQYNFLNLKEELYECNESFTDVLTMFDPDENYYDSDMRGLDAYERQLRRFNIKVSGNDCGKVSNFFISKNAKILFPEFVRRCIESHIRNESWENIFASVLTKNVYDSDSCIFVNGDDFSVIKHPSYPIFKILSMNAHTVKMQRNQTFAVILHSIGRSISNEIISYVVNRLCEIGKENPVMEYNNCSIRDTLSYSMLSNFWANMKDRNMDTIICSPDTLSKILSFDEMKYCVSGCFDGMIRTPYGVTLIKDSNMSDNIVVGIDSSSAIQAKLSNVKIENLHDLITGNFEKIYISVSFSITSIDTNAVSIMYI